MISGDEFLSDAKTFEPVMVKDPKTGEMVDTGMVRVKTERQTSGGVSIDIGRSSGGSSYGESSEAAYEEADDQEETKLDHFWNFPSIENEHTFSSFSDFKKNYFTPFLVAFQQLAVDKKVVADAQEMKTKGRRMNDYALAWIKEHFDNLQFFGPETYYIEGSEVGDKYEVCITILINV